MAASGKVAIVTGAGSGIGRAVALALMREGYAVTLAGRRKEALEAVAAEGKPSGARALVVPTDVGDPASVRALFARTKDAFGRLDVLFNNAGVFYAHTALECSEEEWDEQLDINLKGAFLMSKFALPLMIGQGSGVIINNSSGWGLVGGDRAVAYCASKGGMVLMTKAMAIDHGRQGIRVNCICPGDVDTPMLPADARLRGLKWEEYLAGCATRAMGRIGTPEEIARAVLFLASEDSSFMTGAALVVDGGGTAD